MASFTARSCDKSGYHRNLGLDPRYSPAEMRLLGQRPRYQEGPPRGPVTSGCPPWGRGSQNTRSAIPHLGPLRGHREHSHDSRTLSHQERGTIAEEGTPDRLKLFGSHGQRPWFHEVM